MSENFIYSEMIPEEICDKLVDFFNNNPERHKPDDGCKGKESSEIVLTRKDNIFLEYDHYLSKVLNSYLEKYKYSNSVAKFKTSPTIKIQHYKPGEGFKVYHFENDGNEEVLRRHLVFMTYLNTVENAGTEFLYQETKTEAIKGSTIIWPAAWTHTHRGVVNTKSDKTIVTGWFNFDTQIRSKYKVY